MSEHVDMQQLRRLWELALAEDGADCDVTGRVAVDGRVTATGDVVAREACCFAGAVVFDMVRESCAGQLSVHVNIVDGAVIEAGTVLASINGSLQRLLAVERTLLNFIQRMCGVATMTRRYVDVVAGTSARIYDTRKTIPGWRALDKYAVRCGGGRNHRMGLNDAVLVKDNHLAGIEPARLAATAAGMIEELSATGTAPAFIEFEVDRLEQLDELLKVVGIDIILLDNFSLADMCEAVARRDGLGLRGKVQLEASGGVKLDHVRRIAETGVERIAVGALTHSAPAADIALDLRVG